MARENHRTAESVNRRELVAVEMYFPPGRLPSAFAARQSAAPARRGGVRDPDSESGPGLCVAHTDLANSVACKAEKGSCFMRLVHFCGWTMLLNQ